MQSVACNPFTSPLSYHEQGWLRTQLTSKVSWVVGWVQAAQGLVGSLCDKGDPLVTDDASVEAAGACQGAGSKSDWK